MRAQWRVLRLMLRNQRRALLRGAALSVLVLLMGAALLAVSGWFITAASAAGLAGAGMVFDVFRPSAAVRFLALGRTAARYGERLLTHDATLRALAVLRVRLLSALTRAPHERLLRLRGAQALNRVTADIDALDGIPLRLALPVLSGVVTHLVMLVVLWWLVGPTVAALIAAGYLGGAALVLSLVARDARAPARRAEAAAQAFRTRLIDLIGARADLAVQGQLGAQVARVADSEARRAAEARRLNRIERRAGAMLAVLGAGVLAGALWLAGGLAASGRIAPATAAIGVFAALALTETLVPLRRAVAEQGRIAQAARRVTRLLDEAGPEPTPRQNHRASPRGHLTLSGIVYCRQAGAQPVLDGADLDVAPAETVALAGASGSGKSTLLLIAAGLLPPNRGTVALGGISLTTFPEPALRAAVTLVPQRAALIQGTVAENLRLADPAADDTALLGALRAVSLDHVIAGRGGLDTALGPRGSGLSGGESRRLVLARALLRRPALLLLDEPTEGLDPATAEAVLHGLRTALPDAAILIAAHRPEELHFADRALTLSRGGHGKTLMQNIHS